MNKLQLNNLKLKTFTEQDALDYCLLNNINPNNIIELYLQDNKLTDISGIKIFKNLEILFLSNNRIKDISIIQYLNNLKTLWIDGNKIKDILILRNLNNFKELIY